VSIREILRWFGNCRYHQLMGAAWSHRVRTAILRLIPPDQSLPILMGPARGLRWYPRTGGLGCWAGRYEPEAVAFCADHVRAGDIAWDIGGFVGYYALVFASLVGPDGHVHSCEPDPENRRVLRQHLDANPALAPRVTLHPYGVAGHGGQVGFQSHGASVSRVVADAPLMVDVVALRDVDRAMPNFVKMDVEGMEAEILPGAEDMIAKRQTTWLVETHGHAIKADCLELFRRCGYRTSRLGKHQIVAIP
jgi:FkbM family methyltransferase